MNVRLLNKIGEWIADQKNLNEINLSKCGLNDKDITTLTSAFKSRLERHFGSFDDISPKVTLNLSCNSITNSSVERLVEEAEGLFQSIDLQNTQIDTFSLIIYSLESDITFDMQLPLLKIDSKLLKKAVSDYEELDFEQNKEKGWRFFCDVDSSVSPEDLTQFSEFIKKYNGELIVGNYNPIESSKATPTNNAKRKRDSEEPLQAQKKIKTPLINDLLNNNPVQNRILDKALLRQFLDNKNSAIHFESWNNTLVFNFPSETVISSNQTIELILEILREKNATVKSIEFNHCKFTSEVWDSLIQGLAIYFHPSKIKLSNMTLRNDNISILYDFNSDATPLTSISLNNVAFEKDAELDFTDFVSECKKLKEFHFESRKFFALDSLFLALFQLNELKTLSLKRAKLHAKKKGIKSISFLYDLINRLPNLNKLVIEKSKLSSGDVKNITKSIQLQKLKGEGVRELSLAGSSNMTAHKLAPLFNTSYPLEILNLENMRKSNMTLLSYLETFRKSSCKELHLGNMEFSESLVNLLKIVSKRKYTCNRPEKVVRIGVIHKQYEPFRRLQSYLAKRNIALIAEEIEF